MNVAVMAMELPVEHERSGRCMSNMDTDLQPVHARLDEWANQAKGAFRQLGYPAESYYHKWALLGIAPNPGHMPAMTERAANVDRAVRTLGELDKSVIWRYYMDFRPGDALWKGLHAIEDRNHFNRILKRARYRVSGALAAIE